jgi:hypothetical protein
MRAREAREGRQERKKNCFRRENLREFGWEKEDGLCKNTVIEKELEL